MFKRHKQRSVFISLFLEPYQENWLTKMKGVLAAENGGLAVPSAVSNDSFSSDATVDSYNHKQLANSLPRSFEQEYIQILK